jgi:hypothetical protein
MPAAALEPLRTLLPEGAMDLLRARPAPARDRALPVTAKKS